MEPNKPLFAEEKLELEMDKVIEVEQQPLFEKGSKFLKGFIWGMIIGISILALWILYPKHYGVGSYLKYHDYKCYGFDFPEKGYTIGAFGGGRCIGYLHLYNPNI